MGAVRMLGGIELRRRWRQTLLLTVLVGLVGAIVLAAVAGARRTDGALGRFEMTSRAAELELFAGDATPAELSRFRNSPGVAAVGVLRTGAFEFPRAPSLNAVAMDASSSFGRTVDRPRVITGRLAHPAAPNEVDIGEGLASVSHLRVGDHLDGESFSPGAVAGLLAGRVPGNPRPDGPRFRLKVVGIVRRPLDLGDRGAAGGVLVLTQGFARKYGSEIGSFNGLVLRIRTQHGAADVARVGGEARRIFGGSPQFGVQDLAIDTQGPRSAIDVLVSALWIFAAVTALAGLVVIAIVLGRSMSSGTSQSTQQALGLTRADRIAACLLEQLPVVLGGAALAVVGAVALSPLFPIGVARRAEPGLGVDIDPLVLVVGCLFAAAVIAAIALTAAVRATRLLRNDAQGRGRAETVLDAARRFGIAPVATLGVGMALDPGRGRKRVPVRAGVFGAAFGVLGVVAVITFASSVSHVANTRRLYGWTWDFAAPVTDRPAVDPLRIAREHGIGDAAHITIESVQVDGRAVAAWAIRPLQGRVVPEIVAGRAPTGPNEVSVGAATLSDLGKRIGDTVRIEGPSGRGTFTVVGSAAFPKLDNPQPLANGALVTSAGMDVLENDARTSSNSSEYLAVRVAPGFDVAEVEHRLEHDLPIQPAFGSTVPVEVDRLRQVNWLVVLLAALLAFLALVAVGYALVTGVRRRRSDFAVLKALGHVRGQVRAIVAWQATTLAAIGLCVGIPAGVLAGNLAWRNVADGLGITNSPSIPTFALVVLGPAAIVAVNLVAVLPERTAARTGLAVALRAE